MPECHVVDYSSNSGSAYCVLVGQILKRVCAGRVFEPYLQSLLIGYFGIFGKISRKHQFTNQPPALPALFDHIPNVVVICSEEEVIGINTPSYVAPVQNMISFGDPCSGRNYERQAVCVKRGNFEPDCKVSVSRFSHRTHPQPAAVGFIHLGPKSVHKLLIDKFRVFCEKSFGSVHTSIMNVVSVLRSRQRVEDATILGNWIDWASAN